MMCWNMGTETDDTASEMKRFLEELLSYESVSGQETPALEWLAGKVKSVFDEQYVWTPDLELLLSNIRSC